MVLIKECNLIPVGGVGAGVVSDVVVGGGVAGGVAHAVSGVGAGVAVREHNKDVMVQAGSFQSCQAPYIERQKFD